MWYRLALTSKYKAYINRFVDHPANILAIDHEDSFPDYDDTFSFPRLPEIPF